MKFLIFNGCSVVNLMVVASIEIIITSVWKRGAHNRSPFWQAFGCVLMLKKGDFLKKINEEFRSLAFSSSLAKWIFSWVTLVSGKDKNASSREILLVQFIIWTFVKKSSYTLASDYSDYGRAFLESRIWIVFRRVLKFWKRSPQKSFQTSHQAGCKLKTSRLGSGTSLAFIFEYLQVILRFSRVERNSLAIQTLCNFFKCLNLSFESHFFFVDKKRYVVAFPKETQTLQYIRWQLFHSLDLNCCSVFVFFLWKKLSDSQIQLSLSYSGHKSSKFWNFLLPGPNQSSTHCKRMNDQGHCNRYRCDLVIGLLAWIIRRPKSILIDSAN